MSKTEHSLLIFMIVMLVLLWCLGDDFASYTLPFVAFVYGYKLDR